LTPDSLNVFRSAVTKFAGTVLPALDHATNWFTQISDRSELEAGARRLSLTLGRIMELALLINSSSDNARRFAASGVDLIFDERKT
jgi:hypothetical protein